jgi:hypothetical protein
MAMFEFCTSDLLEEWSFYIAMFRALLELLCQACLPNDLDGSFILLHV